MGMEEVIGSIPSVPQRTSIPLQCFPHPILRATIRCSSFSSLRLSWKRAERSGLRIVSIQLLRPSPEVSNSCKRDVIDLDDHARWMTANRSRKGQFCVAFDTKTNQSLPVIRRCAIYGHGLRSVQRNELSASVSEARQN